MNCSRCGKADEKTGVYFAPPAEWVINKYTIPRKRRGGKCELFCQSVAVQAGICCAIMPLNNGLEALSDNLEIMPIADTEVDSKLALIMRSQQPVSSLAEKCFTDAQVIFSERRPSATG